MVSGCAPGAFGGFFPFLILSFLSLLCLGFGAVLCPGSDLSLVGHVARGPVLDEALGQSLTAVAGDYG